MMQKLILTLCLIALPALAAETDYTKLRKDQRVHEELLAASKAYLIDEQCSELTIRRFYVITTALSLSSYASGLGYSTSEISAYVDSPKEQARFRAIAEPWLASQGAKKGDKAGHCKVGRAEIKKATLLGSLLNEG
jgi:hypothetical protein